MKKITLAAILAGTILTINAQVQSLKESIYFGLGKTSLSREHKAKLDSILIVLKSSKSYSGEIKGYTCTIGSVSINKIVSNLRALNVYNYLIDRGAKKDNFTYIGLGSTNPQASNSTAAGRVKNRRADVEVILSITDAPSTSNSSSGNPTKTSSSTSGITYGTSRIASEYTGYQRNYKPSSTSGTSSSTSTSSSVNSATTGSGSSSSSSASSSNSSSSSNTKIDSKETSTSISSSGGKANATGSAAKEAFTPAVELGPEFTSGKFPAAGNVKVTSSNGILWEIDKNTFVTSSKEPIEVDFKDYTRNAEIIRKGLSTKGNGKEYRILGAFNVNFTQEYQDLAINSRQPLRVFIPGEYDENMALYSNHKNWTRDTMNKLTYDDYRKAYVISVVNNSQMLALMKPVASSTEKLEYLKIKIKGLSPDYIKPYIIYDDCTISNGSRLSGKWFIFPIAKRSGTYRLRAAYTDYSSKSGQPYSLNYDINNLDKLTNLKTSDEEGKITVKYPEKISMSMDKLPISSLCEMNSTVGTNDK